jgi:membrane protease YdiL (CAAX protease family)
MYGIKPASISLIAFAILTVILFIPLVSALHEWNQSLQLPQFFAALESYLKELESQAETLTKAFLTTDSWGGLLYTLLIIAVIPALGEELLFRGALQTELQRWFRNGHLAVWLAAAIFSFIHFQFYGFLPRMVMGAVLGYLYLYSNNLWLPIAGHFANNAFGVLWFQLEQSGAVPSEKENSIADSWSGLALALLLAFASLALLVYIKKQVEKSRYLTYGS